MTLLDKVSGCLIAGAIGDSFGYNVEFNDYQEIIRLYGEYGLMEMIEIDGKYIISDDTQMTLFTLEGLLLADANDTISIIRSVFYSYLRWFDTQFGPGAIPEYIASFGRLHKIEDLFYMRDPGHACIDALRHRKDMLPPDFAHVDSINISKGCGSVIRAAPIGCLIHLSADEIFQISYNCAAITHGDEEAKLASALFSLIIYNLLKDGQDIERDIFRAIRIIDGYIDYKCNEWEHICCLLNIVFEIYHHGLSNKKLAFLGEGWLAAEALALGIYSFLLGGECLLKTIYFAANRTGDSDSIASIAGNLYGAKYGFAKIDSTLYDKLEFKALILEMSQNFIQYYKL